MACACDGYCNNNECSTYIATCPSNIASFTTIGSGTVINATHLNQIRTATDDEYLRRGLSVPSWPSYPATGGLTMSIAASRYNTAKSNVNALNSVITSVFSVSNIIYASQTQEFQNDINVINKYCICNTHCSCVPNCTCDVNCDCDYHPNSLRRI